MAPKAATGGVRGSNGAAAVQCAASLSRGRALVPGGVVWSIALAIGFQSACALHQPARPPFSPNGVAAGAIRLFSTERPDFDVEVVTARIAALAAQAETEIAGLSSAHDRVGALNRLFFQELGFKAVQGLHRPENLFLDDVLRKRKGYCTSLVLVYAAVAEAVELPIYAVATPRHLFLRYDDGQQRVNIETLQAGRELTDDEYRRQYRIAEAAVENGVYLRNLTTAELLSQVANNLGVLRSLRDDFDHSEDLYRRALRLDPRNTTAIYNLARDRMRQARLKTAVRGFSRVLELDPHHLEALNNRGICWATLGEKAKAEVDFRTVLDIDPGFVEARRNLAKLGAKP